jgi:hypothetical protein
VARVASQSQRSIGFGRRDGLPVCRSPDFITAQAISHHRDRNREGFFSSELSLLFSMLPRHQVAITSIIHRAACHPVAAFMNIASFLSATSLMPCKQDSSNSRKCTSPRLHRPHCRVDGCKMVLSRCPTTPFLLHIPISQYLPTFISFDRTIGKQPCCP